MDQRFERTRMLLGEAAMLRLKAARVAVFGVGGVGGYTVEALARSGVGALDVVDADTVAVSNINRQIIALTSTVGQLKVDAAEARVRDIDPSIRVNKHPVFFGADTAGGFDFASYDYVVDAVDTVTAKLLLIECAKRAGVPVISCMGAGNKLDPTAFRVADISKTSVCPLARVMRRELRKRGIEHVKVVYSQEQALTPEGGGQEDGSARRQTPGSTAFVPSVAGLIIAAEVIKDLTGGLTAGGEGPRAVNGPQNILQKPVPVTPDPCV